MSFSKAFLDELKSRFRLSDIVGRTVKLTKHGREFKGLSPFTNEKTPSFTVNDQKGFYHCFSSGEHGDAIGFLMKVKGFSFVEAVKLLADEAGMELPQQTAQDREWEKRRSTLNDVMEMAATFYGQELRRPNGKTGLDYFHRRGLKEATITSFRLGFAPSNRTALHDHLLQKEVTPDQMEEAGLIIKPDDGRKPYDRFRGRVMFPIENASGKVIAFGGRALDANTPAKYLNSPETPLFHKGSVLYNFKNAREACYRGTGLHGNTLIVAEGYMDVIALSEAGFETSVAPLGTALTENQIELLWKVCPEPILCFDGDRAGVQAAYRVVDRALPLLKPGHSLRFALLPEGKDPDDIIRAGGPAAMNELLEQAQPLASLLWERELSAAPYDTPERRAGLEQRLRDLVRSVKDERIRQHYGQDFKDRLQGLFQPRSKGGAGQSRSRQFSPNRGRKSGSGGRFVKNPSFGLSPELRRSSLVKSATTAEDAQESLLVLTILNHPELLNTHFEDFATLEFTNQKLDTLRNEIISIAALDEPLDRTTLNTHLKDTECAPYAQFLTDQKGLKSELFAQEEASIVEAERGWLYLLSRYRNVSMLQRELREAEQALARDMTEENLERLKAVKAQLYETERDLSETDIENREAGQAHLH